MYRIGIDSVEISRIKESLSNKRFLNENFGENELRELEKRGFPSESVAAAFAVKEAFSKAVGTGFGAFSLKEVETLHLESGKPYLSLSGSAKALAKNDKSDVSITHTSFEATAVIILYNEQSGELK